MTTTQTNTRKNIVIIATLIAVIFGIFATTGFAAANAESTGYLTGTAWVDSNNNNMREPNETVAADTAIYLRPVGNNAAVAGGMVIFSDANGNFDFGSVGFGSYEVQAEHGQMVQVTLSEVNAAISVELPVAADGPDASNGQSYQIFLPLVIR